MKLEEEVTDIPCEKCGRMMVVKYGKYGKFLACPGYPECKNVKPFVEKIDVPCPVCGGEVHVRKTKRGRKYYICENNPKSCNYISWNKPKLGEKWEPEQEKTAGKTKKTRAKKTSSKDKTTTKASSNTAKAKKSKTTKANAKKAKKTTAKKKTTKSS